MKKSAAAMNGNGMKLSNPNIIDTKIIDKKIDIKEFDEDLNFIEDKLDKLRKDLDKLIAEAAPHAIDEKKLNMEKRLTTVAVKAAADTAALVVKKVQKVLEDDLGKLVMRLNEVEKKRCLSLKRKHLEGD